MRYIAGAVRVGAGTAKLEASKLSIALGQSGGVFGYQNGGFGRLPKLRSLKKNTNACISPGALHRHSPATPR